jgi:flagellin
MIINHNIAAMNTLNNLNAASTAQASSLQKLSSGQRINSAADDAAGLAISEKMRSQIRGMDQATSNAQDGISYIQTAEGALNEVSDMLTRMKELKVQGANGTYSTDDNANINLELDQLTKEIGNITDNTDFNGKNVFTSSTNIVIGDDGTTCLTVGAATISTTKALTSSSSVSNIESAITEINAQRAQYGAYQNRLEHTINNLTTTDENLTASESRIRDVDMAKEMSTYTKNNILVQSATAMLSQANSAPQTVLSLLK